MPNDIWGQVILCVGAVCALQDVLQHPWHIPSMTNENVHWSLKNVSD